MKSFCIAGANPADLEDRDEFKDEMNKMKAALKDLAGIPDDPVLGSEPGEENAVGAETNEVCLAFGKVWNSLPIDGPQADKEIGQKLIEQEKLEKRLRELTEEERNMVMAFEKEAHRIVRQRVVLLEESDRKETFVQELKAALSKATATAGLLVAYDQKQCGEAMTSPHVRCPPLRAERLRKAVTWTLESLDADFLPEFCTFVIMDAFSLGNKMVPLIKYCHA